MVLRIMYLVAVIMFTFMGSLAFPPLLRDRSDIPPEDSIALPSSVSNSTVLPIATFRAGETDATNEGNATNSTSSITTDKPTTPSPGTTNITNIKTTTEGSDECEDPLSETFGIIHEIFGIDHIESLFDIDYSESEEDW